jgi:hypothetical protein
VSINLNLDQLTGSQSNKHVTVNDANGQIDAAITVKTDNIFHITDGAPVPTAAITLTVPAVSRGMFVVVNETSFAVTVTISGQSLTAPVVATGSNNAVALTCDGVNVRAVAAVGNVANFGIFNFSSAGHNVALSTATNFNLTSFVNKGFTYKITVDETAGLVTGTYDLEFYAKDTFLAADLLYQVTGIDPTTAAPNWSDQLPIWLQDEDASTELHMRINNTDTGNQGTYTVTVDIYELP